LTAVAALIRAGRPLDPYVAFGLVGTLTRPYWRYRFAGFGAQSLLYRPEWVHRPDLMVVGERVWIGPRAWLEVGGPALESRSPVLRIGDGVVLRHHVTISAHESVVIEDDVLIAAWSSIYDSDHIVGGPGNPVWQPTLNAPVRIGRGTWLGERVAVLRGSDIGAHCVIGANSVVRGTIPDHSVAVGAPARVVGSTRG
jgi:acetyltransferase-like isoleucine patch superfamily enzyme